MREIVLAAKHCVLSGGNKILPYTELRGRSIIHPLFNGPETPAGKT
jgi:hypothetical protein